MAKVIALSEKEVNNRITLQEAMKDQLSLLHQIATEIDNVTTVAYLLSDTVDEAERTRLRGKLDEVRSIALKHAFTCKEIPAAIDKSLKDQQECVAVTSPKGTISAVPGNEPNFPGIQIKVKDELVAIVEFNSIKEELNLIAYGMNSDEPILEIRLDD